MLRNLVNPVTRDPIEAQSADREDDRKQGARRLPGPALLCEPT
jgi:hypothetical protein